MSATISEAEVETVRQLLLDVKTGASTLKDTVADFHSRLSTSNELTYPTGISLLSLKNHLLLSYLHHLTTLFSLRLSSNSLKDHPVVDGLVKLRVVLEKIAPLEGKLKYQVEKLVRKADLAAEGGDDEDIVNGSSPGLFALWFYVWLITCKPPRRSVGIQTKSCQSDDGSYRIRRRR